MEQNKPEEIEGGATLENVEKETFVCESSALFKIKTSDETLRGLMHFMQQEGIMAQNTISAAENDGRLMHLWVNAADKEKIQKHLEEQSLKSA